MEYTTVLFFYRNTFQGYFIILLFWFIYKNALLNISSLKAIFQTSQIDSLPYSTSTQLRQPEANCLSSSSFPCSQHHTAKPIQQGMSGLLGASQGSSGHFVVFSLVLAGWEIKSRQGYSESYLRLCSGVYSQDKCPSDCTVFLFATCIFLNPVEFLRGTPKILNKSCQFLNLNNISMPKQCIFVQLPSLHAILLSCL